MDQTPQEPVAPGEEPDNDPNTDSDVNNHRYDEEGNVDPLEV